MTAVKTPDPNLAHELRCHIQRSVRYHKARQRFFDGWSNAVSFVSLLGGSAVVVAVLNNSSDVIAICAGLIVAAGQALEQVVRLGSKARDHSTFTSQFVSLERALERSCESTDPDLRAIKAEILMIEAQEPPIKRYLDLICHNQVARSIGSSDIQPLAWWQRMFAQYLNGDSAMEM